MGIFRTYFIHLTLVPYLRTAGEIKTKPTQHSTKELRSIGIQPDILICRSDNPLPETASQKIAMFSNLNPSAVISLPDVDSIYTIPLLLHQQNLDTKILTALEFTPRSPANLTEWEDILEAQKNPIHEITIGMIGKYTELADSYKSVSEALIHAGIKTRTRIQIQYIDAEEILIENQSLLHPLTAIDAILVPGGFGVRGIEGKINAACYARENNVPYLGICLGMQAAVIDFARHQAGLTKAHSTECDPNTPYPVIALVTEWTNIRGKVEKRSSNAELGGTLRLGSQVCYLASNTLANQIYRTTEITERHRHRYEVNALWTQHLVSKGLCISGQSIEGLVEIIELPNHPWFIGCQFHLNLLLLLE